MPNYKNRPLLDAGTEVRHYTSLDALTLILKSNQLRFTRIDTFADPFEGSVPKKTIDDQLPLFAGATAQRMMWTGIAAHYSDMKLPEWTDLWEQATQRRKAKTRSAHVSSWTAGEESEAMWRLYCREGSVLGVGVSLRTTLSKLEASVASHDLYFSPIRYRAYHEGPAFDDELDALMHKRFGFRHEQEVRILKFDDAQYHALCRPPQTGPPVAPPTDLPQHVHIDWSLTDTIDEITVSPYPSGTADYEQKVKETIQAIDPALLGRVQLSVLSERRYPAHF